MEQATINLAQLAATSKHFAGTAHHHWGKPVGIIDGGMQEERERLLHAMLLALGVAALSLLGCDDVHGRHRDFALEVRARRSAGGADQPLRALAIYLHRRLTVLQRDWKSFPATLDQLRKDRECLEKPSPESIGIAEAIIGRGKRTQPHAIDRGMAGDDVMAFATSARA